jgi:hypothetical protein
MGPFLQMRGSCSIVALPVAYVLVLLFQTSHFASCQSAADPAHRATGPGHGSSGCTMDLGRKDLAPVFASCRWAEPLLLLNYHALKCSYIL